MVEWMNEGMNEWMVYFLLQLWAGLKQKYNTQTQYKMSNKVNKCQQMQWLVSYNKLGSIIAMIRKTVKLESRKN